MKVCKYYHKESSYGFCKSATNPQDDSEFFRGVLGGLWPSCQTCRDYARERKGQRSIKEIVGGKGSRFADEIDRVNYELWLGRMKDEVRRVSEVDI